MQWIILIGDEGFSNFSLEKPNFILMRYTDRKIMKKCLQAENFPTNIYVDDDDTLDVPIVKIQEFIDSLEHLR